MWDAARPSILEIPYRPPLDMQWVCLVDATLTIGTFGKAHYSVPIATRNSNAPTYFSVSNLVAHLSSRNWDIQQIVTSLKRNVTVLRNCKLLARGAALVQSTFPFAASMKSTAFTIVYMYTVRAQVYKVVVWISQENWRWQNKKWPCCWRCSRRQMTQTLGLEF